MKEEKTWEGNFGESFWNTFCLYQYLFSDEYLEKVLGDFDGRFFFFLEFEQYL